jgi:phage portal protein BeeE
LQNAFSAATGKPVLNEKTIVDATKSPEDASRVTSILTKVINKEGNPYDNLMELNGLLGTDYTAEQVMHWREFNPDYDYHGGGHLKGMSRLRPILKSVIGSGSSYDALVAAFQHHGAVGILTLLGEDGKVQKMSKTFLSSIKSQYRKEYTGPKKSGSIVITDRDHKWSNFGMTVVEMNIIKAIGVFGGKIYDAYNVPSVLMSGSEDKTYANYKEANKALWANAIKPSTDALLKRLSDWLAPRFKEEGQYLAADYSEVEALQTDKATMIAWMVMAKSFTKNEIREAAGFERLEDPNMDRIYESAGTMPLEELGFMPDQDITEGVLKALRQKDYRIKN